MPSTDKFDDNAVEMPGSGSSLRATFAALTFLLLVTCIFFRKPLFEGKVFYVADHAAICVPMHVYNARLRADGQIPLWNRHGFLGYPNQAETELSGVYPPGLIFNVVQDPGMAYTYYIIFHWFIAGAGMMYLLRAIGAGVLGQTLAAIVFVFGGTFVGHTYTTPELATFAWTPLMLGFLLSAFHQRAYSFAAMAGIVFGIQTLGAFAQQSFYTCLVIMLATLSVAGSPNRRSQFPFAVKATLLMVVIGLGLSACQVLYLVEYMSMTELWRGFGYETQVQYSLPPNYLLQLLVPNLFGENYYIFFSLAILRVYWGVLSLGLIALGWTSSGRSVSLLRIVFVFGLILALGRFSGVYNLISELPGFRQIHYPCRALPVVSLAAAGLAGLGMNRFVRGDFGARWPRALTWSYCLLAAMLLAVVMTVKFNGSQAWVWRSYDLLTKSGLDKVGTFTLDRSVYLAGFMKAAMIAACLAGTTGLFWMFHSRFPKRSLAGLFAIGLLALDLVICNGRVHNFGPSDYYSAVPSSVARLRSDSGLYRVYGYSQNLYNPNLGGFPGDTGALFGTDTLNSGAGVILKDLALFLGPYYEYSTWKELGLLNVKYFLVPRKLMEDTNSNVGKIDPALRSAGIITGQTREHDLQMFEVREFQPRVSVREDYFVRPTLFLAKHLINSEEFSASASVTIDESPGFLSGKAVDPMPTDAQAKVVSYAAQRVLIEATLPRPGILVLSDLDYPGWRATSNGRDLEILTANGLVRGLALGPGRHHIEFAYHPRSFYTGLYIGLTTLGLLAVWGIVAVFRRKR